MNFEAKSKIVNGDSLKELKKIPDETFDLVFADPPYNLQLKNELSRPDQSKVSAVNDKWDQFENFKIVPGQYLINIIGQHSVGFSLFPIVIQPYSIDLPSNSINSSLL